MFVSLKLATKSGMETHLQPGDIAFFNKYDLGTSVTVMRENETLLIGPHEPDHAHVFLHGVDVAAACLVATTLLRLSGFKTISSLHPKCRIEIFSIPPHLVP